MGLQSPYLGYQWDAGWFDSILTKFSGHRLIEQVKNEIAVYKQLIYYLFLVMLMKEREKIINEYVKLSHIALHVILLNLRNKQVETAFEAGYKKQCHALGYLRVLV